MAGEPCDPAFVALKNNFKVHSFFRLDILLVKYFPNAIVDDLHGCVKLREPVIHF